MPRLTMMKVGEAIQESGVMMYCSKAQVSNLPVASASWVGLSAAMCLIIAPIMLVELLASDRNLGS